jgi:hypothetical protein
MFRGFTAATAAIGMLFSSPASAEMVKGLVVYDKGCRSILVIQTNMGYLLANHYGGQMPINGDYVVGELDEYGIKYVWDLRSDSSFEIYIENYMMSKQSVIDKLNEKCQ